jgi:periplasmic mercuric ion binding protein
MVGANRGAVSAAGRVGAAGRKPGLLAAAGAAERTVPLAVENMYRDACPYIVRRSRANVPGVETVAVSFEKRTATVSYDDQKATLAALIDAITKAGDPSKAIP